MRKLWGQVGDNTVRRLLDKIDMRRLKKGKEVYCRVNGVTVVLSTQERNPALDRLEDRIKKLEAKKEALLKGATSELQAKHR